MAFQAFELERWQSDYEQTVDVNLADSSVRGARISEVLGREEWERFLALELGYPEVNGTELLRHLVTHLYPSAATANVLVTVGGAEANQLVCQTLLEPGDRVIVMEPGYRQVSGLAAGLGCQVVPFPLDPDEGWRPVLERLEHEAKAGAKLIYVVNPNNPTGTVLSPHEMQLVTEIADRTGAWLVADEVYRGAELWTDEETPTFWNQYERVVAVNSLSKAYGLAGLRIGWAVAPASLVGPLWRRHEYAVISAAGPSMRLAELALDPATRPRVLARQRKLSRSGWDMVAAWLAANPGLVSCVTPAATAIAFVRYHLDLDSVAVAHAIRKQASVLVAPGAYLGADRHLRITHGVGRERVEKGLEGIGRVLRALGGRGETG